MTPRKTRAARPGASARDVKSAAPSPSPSIASRPSGKKQTRSKKATNEVVVEEETGEEEVGDGVEAEAEALEEEHEDRVEAEEDAAEGGGEETLLDGDGTGEETEDGPGEGSGGDTGGETSGESSKTSMADRLAKLKDLRIRMNQSTAENRRDLVADHQKSRVTSKELARLEKQRKLAQTLRSKADAEETGEDLERRKNWEWSIVQNERWEAKMADQKVRGDSSFHNAEDEAHKLYNRNLRSTKPDLIAYERQKELALGLAPGTLVPAGMTSAQLAISGPSRTRGLTASEDLYRGANTLSYGDSKPSEDAVDRVVGKINKDMSKGKRKKADDEDEPVTYINDRNKVFNKKIARYFDKYTKEIRANFERGTAL